MFSTETEAAGRVGANASVNAACCRYQSGSNTTGNAAFARPEFSDELCSDIDQLRFSHVTVTGVGITFLNEPRAFAIQGASAPFNAMRLPYYRRDSSRPIRGRL